MGFAQKLTYTRIPDRPRPQNNDCVITLYPVLMFKHQANSMVWDTDAEFKELYETHMKGIRSYLSRLTNNDADLVEDVLQETFIRIYKYRDKFDPEKGKFFSWACRIAHNTFLIHFNRNKKRLHDENLDHEGVAELASEDDTGRAIEKMDLMNEIKDAILSLPEPERTILYNRKIKKRTLAQTAEALGVTVRTVSRKLAGALELVQAELTKREVFLD